jgi:hypothetical protein
MTGTIPVLLIYVFMAWTGKASLLQKHNLAESFIVLFAGSTIKNLPKIGAQTYTENHNFLWVFVRTVLRSFDRRESSGSQLRDLRVT